MILPILVPSTRRHKAKARRSGEMDMMSGFEIMAVLLASENANPLERELAYIINGSVSNNDIESNSHIRTNPLDENGIKSFSQLPRQDRILDSRQTFSNEINMRLSQEMDAVVSMKHSQINRVFNSTISERVILELQIIMSSISLGNRDTESGLSLNNQENNNDTSGL